jgi:hypothetical protein
MPEDVNMTQDQTRRFFLWAGILLIVVIIAAGFYQAGPNKGLSSAGEILTFIALAAVGIERIIEGFWTFIGLTKGTLWPFSALSQQITSLSNDLNKTLEPFYNELEQTLQEAKVGSTLTAQEFESATKQLDHLKTSVQQITTLAPGNQQAAALASAASQIITEIQKSYPTLQTLGTFANEAIGSFANVVATPPDNLGRRFISLFVGTLLGLLITGLLRLDLVQAIFQSPTFGNAFGLQFYWGIIFTGVVMGLGSNPTHEVIRVLQEYKKTLKIQNTTS